MASDNKYDRQLRMWGKHGQQILSTSKVLMLNGTASCCETLKNLILPGIQFFTVVDSHKVTKRDCGNNFFVSHEDIGKPRCQVVSELLLEMNPDVKGDYLEASVEDTIQNKKDFIA
jgi:amyloid beta precursor protein binding protein 1